MASVTFTTGEVTALNALSYEAGESLNADEIGNIATHHIGDGDAAQEALPLLLSRGLVMRDPLDITRFLLTEVGTWAIEAMTDTNHADGSAR